MDPAAILSLVGATARLLLTIAPDLAGAVAAFRDAVAGHPDPAIATGATHLDAAINGIAGPSGE